VDAGNAIGSGTLDETRRSNGISRMSRDARRAKTFAFNPSLARRVTDAWDVDVIASRAATDAGINRRIMLRTTPLARFARALLRGRERDGYV